MMGSSLGDRGPLWATSARGTRMFVVVSFWCLGSGNVLCGPRKWWGQSLEVEVPWGRLQQGALRCLALVSGVSVRAGSVFLSGTLKKERKKDGGKEKKERKKRQADWNNSEINEHFLFSWVRAVWPWMKVRVNIINTWCISMSEAVTTSSLIMVTSIVSKKSLARDRQTGRQTDIFGSSTLKFAKSLTTLQTQSGISEKKIREVSVYFLVFHGHKWTMWMVGELNQASLLQLKVFFSRGMPDILFLPSISRELWQGLFDG